jgi:hypothetical protein
MDFDLDWVKAYMNINDAVDAYTSAQICRNIEWDHNDWETVEA